MRKIRNSIPNQDKAQSTGFSRETRREVAIIVGLNTLQNDTLLMVRSAFTAKRRTIFPTCVGVVNAAKAVSNRMSLNSKWFNYNIYLIQNKSML